MRLRIQIKAWKGEVLLSTLRLAKALSRPKLLRRLYQALLIRLVKQTGLFDSTYYLETNGDVAEAGIAPIKHYVMSGDREGRSPMALFDPAYYRSQLMGSAKSINALLHYAYVGYLQQQSPSPWFDVKYYLKINKDIERAHVEPLQHYLTNGGLEGRSPSPQFDGSSYLRANPDVAEARMNPLLHYLRYGRLEGRSPVPSNAPADDRPAENEPPPTPRIPSEESWFALPSRASIAAATVDVIVPVYKGRIETLRCLHSVLSASGTTPFELVVINDASPDAQLTKNLERLAELRLFTFSSNSNNRGFVHTVNCGMALHPDRDVVLLNADTEVYDGWLDRLVAAAGRDPYTGTVTPLSNNATICSYPRFLHDNPFPLEVSYAELDAIAAEMNADLEAETPTCVGFCTYIKRACLNEVGLFDEKAFGKGYGEENDFSQRAIRRGWRNVITANIFVRHWGSTSFQGEKSKRIQAALKIVANRYPDYHRDVAQFIALDPLKEARQRLDWGRLQRLRREKNVLIISHNRGGGTERHVQEDVQRLTRDGYGVYLLRPMPGRGSHVTLGHHATRSLPNILPLALEDIRGLRQALIRLGITEVHTHSLVDAIPDAPEYITTLIGSIGASWEVNLHDYKVICPRINLADENGRYCGEPSETECNQCLAVRGSDFGTPEIGAWRTMHRRVLTTANKVLVPDDDVADRLMHYFPEVAFEVSPHEDIGPRDIKITTPALQPGETLHITVIGAISRVKGFDVLLACAQDAQKRDLPLRFTLMGYSHNDRLLEKAGVHVTGRYIEEEALSRLRTIAPHAVWLPSLWPETYSYTLSLALQAGYPVFAFDIGAIATRLRKLAQDDYLMPLSCANKPPEINSIFSHTALAWDKNHTPQTITGSGIKTCLVETKSSSP